MHRPEASYVHFLDTKSRALTSSTMAQKALPIAAGGRAREPFLDCCTTRIGLDDDVDHLDGVQVRRVALLPPIRRTRQSQGRNVMEPECVAVGFALDQHPVARGACGGQSPRTKAHHA